MACLITRLAEGQGGKVLRLVKGGLRPVTLHALRAAACLLLSGLFLGSVTGSLMAGEPKRQWPSSRHKTIEQDPQPCTCRYFNKRYDIGETICLTQSADRKVAICTMVINNPSWQVTDTPCPSAELNPSGTRLATALLPAR